MDEIVGLVLPPVLVGLGIVTAAAVIGIGGRGTARLLGLIGAGVLVIGLAVTVVSTQIRVAAARNGERLETPALAMMSTSANILGYLLLAAGVIMAARQPGGGLTPAPPPIPSHPSPEQSSDSRSVRHG